MSAYPYLTLVDIERLGVALSNLGDVQGHIRGRIEELLDLAEKLGIHTVHLSKRLRKAAERRAEGRNQ